MTKKSSEYYLLQGIVVVSIALILLVSYAVTDVLKSDTSKIDDENITYVSYEVLTDNIMPVVKQENEETKNSYIKPYKDENVVIGKKYYDYKAEDKDQENSIIYYENTYMQNTGIDYTSKEVFVVNAIADGKVLSVTKDDITGTTIKIEHDNDIISVYQSVNDVKVNENDPITKGQELANSGTNNISSDLGNHLHFEILKNNNFVNPETFFESNQGN